MLAAYPDIGLWLPASVSLVDLRRVMTWCISWHRIEARVIEMDQNRNNVVRRIVLEEAQAERQDILGKLQQAGMKLAGTLHR